VPIANGISSAALDTGLYMFTSAIVTMAGLTTALLLAPVSGKWRFYALLFAGVLLAFVALLAVAIGRRWQMIGSTTRAIGRVPQLQRWISSKQSVIDSAEDRLLDFHREAPRAFWASLMLNFVCHALAVLEVYIVLRFMGVRVPLIGALALEGLTKLVNLVGALIPGNVGTYEGGNVLVTKLFHITAASGLTLALCRRARALFWAAIGALCLILMKRQQQTNDLPSQRRLHGIDGNSRREEFMNPDQQKQSKTVIIMGNDEQSLAHVGILPVLLRTILTVQGTATRIVVCIPSVSAQQIKSTLYRTGRMPSFVEWCEIGPEMNLSSLIGEVAPTSESITLLLGNRTYQPRLLQHASEWEGDGALAFATVGEPTGIYVLSQSAAIDLSKQSKAPIQTLDELHVRMQSFGSVDVEEVAADSWQGIAMSEDLLEAEKKLDKWLVKPTDGLFACANRRISIPISRQLIKLPITPNMVTMFVLAVSFGCGVFFARGGYWNTLVAAILSVAASILDGCDGEVARLKLQSSNFGCWLETIGDYLYYLFVFGGMAIGLTKSSGDNGYLVWGAFLFSGAIMSFLVVSYSRQRLSGAQPEKFLAVWQKKADTRPFNPLVFIGRHTEFIIRRCFFPYAILFFAIVNLTRFVFVATAVIANLVWIIALYSAVAFSRNKRSSISANSPAALSATGS
jgi:phosphatidylglycerophosphate synthase